MRSSCKNFGSGTWGSCRVDGGGRGEEEAGFSGRVDRKSGFAHKRGLVRTMGKGQGLMEVSAERRERDPAVGRKWCRTRFRAAGMVSVERPCKGSGGVELRG